MPTCKILSFVPLALLIFCGECDELYERVGGEVTMNCGIPQKRDVEWKLNDILIVKINGRNGVKSKGGSHISGKVIANEGILKVPKLETRDSGLYSCYSGKQYSLYVVSVFAKPGPVVVQSSDVELHCDVPEKAKSEVHWQSPSKSKMKGQVIKLKSVTSEDKDQWTCVFKNLNISLTLTVVAGLQTTAVQKVPEGDNITLPCSLPRSVSQRVVGGTWTADHLPTESFPTLKNSEGNGLHWNSEKPSRITFTSEKLSINYDVTLTNARREDEGKYVCKVVFEGGAELTAEMNLTVLAKSSGKLPAGQEGNGKGKGKKSTVDGPWKKELLGLQLWIWIAVGASSVVLIGLIFAIVFIWKRNNRTKKRRAKKQRSLRQPLTARDYCQCGRGESEVQFVEQEKPLPMPRKQRNPRTRTAGANHTVEKSREQDYY